MTAINDSNLPEYCYGATRVPNSVIIIEKGESGYYKSAFPKQDSYEAAEAMADKYNELLGVTKAQRMAMEHGSMWGWDTRLANPERWTEDGKPMAA